MDGLINIYKEAGWTSFDVVAKLRGILKEKKIGHTGTLDPQAEGVLPVCIGNATKVCALLTGKDKEYEAVLQLGVSTDTQDATGKVLCDLSDAAVRLDRAEVCRTIEGFIGDYDQMPPMYSALKVGGRKLCDLAREGVEVERKARRVHIYGIEVTDMNLPLVTMRVHCSKGTYIRTLCDDIGNRLGVGGMMKSLTRTRAGDFALAESVTLAQVKEHRDAGTMGQILIPVERVFAPLPALHVKEHALVRVHNGNRLKRGDFADGYEAGTPADGARFRVYDAGGKFCGVYGYDGARRDFPCEKLFM